MKLRDSWFTKNWIALLAIVISAISAWFAFDQSRFARQLAHVHVEPVIRSVFDLPEKGNPVYIVSNQGDLSVVSLSVTHKAFVINKETGRIWSAVQMGQWFGNKAIYTDELKPTEFKTAELVDVQPPRNQLSVYVFKLKYYRGSDMKLYEKEDLFFVDARKVINHMDFRKNSLYPLIMSEIEKFSFPQYVLKPGSMKEMAESWKKEKNKKK